MRLAILSTIVFALAQGGNEAEKLFRESEKKLADADTAKITVTSTMDGTKGKAGLKGTLVLAKGNKARVEFNGDVFGKKFKMTMVSDGAKTKAEMSLEMAPAKGPQEKDTPKNFNTIVAGSLSRAGAFGGLFMSRAQRPGEKEPGVDELFKVADFTLGKKEKIGERQAQMIDYKLTMAGGDTVNAKVWLDTETKLPLKRVISASKDKESIRITETYEIRVNGKVDGKKFELPK